MERENLIPVDCAVCDGRKEKTVTILKQGNEIGIYTVYYYSDDSDEVYFNPITEGKEGSQRKLSGLYQGYAHGAKSIRESIILDLREMGYDIEDAENKLSDIY